MWINKFGKEENKGRPNRSLQDYDRKGSNIAHKFFEVSMKTEPEGTDTSFIKNELGSGGIDFSVRGL